LRQDAVPTLFAISNPPPLIGIRRRPLKRARPVDVPAKPESPPSTVSGMSTEIATSDIGHVSSLYFGDHGYGKKRISSVSAKEKKCSTDHLYAKGVAASAVVVDMMSTVQGQSDASGIVQNSAKGTFDSNDKNITVQSRNDTVVVKEMVHAKQGLKTWFDRLRTEKDAMIAKLKGQLLQEKARNRKLTNEVANLNGKVDNMKKNLDKFLNSDQISQLDGTRYGKWTANTVRNAMKIRTAVGKNGYEFLRKTGYPLPSYRTLCERVEVLQMPPGIQYDILDFLELKTRDMCQRERDCVLLIDEVQLKRKIEYDSGLKVMTGYTSSEFAFAGRVDEEASHALVFMSKGMCVPYKQTVAWFLTGNRTTGRQLWSVTKTVIKELFERSLVVRVITSDMGAANVGMWKEAGLQLNDENSTSYIPHPCQPSLSLYFMADVPHLIKNLRSCLEKNDIILPECSAASLPTREVSMSHIEAVVKIQESSELKVVPGLSRANIHPGQYAKMRVGIATKVFSRSTASALRDLASNGKLHTSALTTGWFCDEMNDWFDIMSNRIYKKALFTESTDLERLNTIVDLIKGLQVRGKSGLAQSTLSKPWQKGMVLSTKTVIALHKALVAEGDYTFLLTCRLTQDALENLFSQIRGYGDAHPSVVRFRVCLKHITVSQLLDVPKNGSYEIDTLPNLVDFVKTVRVKKVEEMEEEVAELANVEGISDGNVEEKALYYLAGWVAHKMKRTHSSCSQCCTALCETEHVPILPQASLTCVKSYGGLTHPSEELFNIIQEAEILFRTVNERKINVAALCKIQLERGKQKLKSCSEHGSLHELALKRYLKLRMHIRASYLTEQLSLKAQYASKSAVARTTIL
jgi:hypothetical protein